MLEYRAKTGHNTLCTLVSSLYNVNFILMYALFIKRMMYIVLKENFTY